MARKPIEIDNTFLSNLFRNKDGFWDIEDWMKDVIYGSSRTGYSNPSSPLAIFKALGTLEVINFDSVSRFVNRKSELIDGKSFRDRHVYAFMGRVISARKGIEFYYERKTGEKFYINSPDFSNSSEDFTYADGLKASEIL